MRLHFAGGAVIFLGFLLAQTFIAALTCPSHSLRSSRALSFMNARAKAQPRRLASGLHVLVAVSIRTCDSYRDLMRCPWQGTCIFSSGFHQNVRQLQGFDMSQWLTSGLPVAYQWLTSGLPSGLLPAP